MPATQETPTASPIGRKTPRVDGPLKVSGVAQYASDFHFPGMLYAVPTTFELTKRVQSERGNPERAFASAPVKLDQTYVTPTETHNPIELQATTAIWDGQMLTIYEESQAVFNLRSVFAQMFGLPKE